jgi:hypothetical protein
VGAQRRPPAAPAQKRREANFRRFPDAENDQTWPLGGKVGRRISWPFGAALPGVLRTAAAPRRVGRILRAFIT